MRDALEGRTSYSDYSRGGDGCQTRMLLTGRIINIVQNNRASPQLVLHDFLAPVGTIGDIRLTPTGPLSERNRTLEILIAQRLLNHDGNLQDHHHEWDNQCR